MCPKHKNYRAVRKPTVRCLSCWRVWFDNYGEDKVDVDVFGEILDISTEQNDDIWSQLENAATDISEILGELKQTYKDVERLKKEVEKWS